MITPRPYQTEACRTILGKWKEGVTRQVVSLPTGCHAYGQGILMADGQIRRVETIEPEELIMGNDGTPRTVLQKRYGREDMYRIKPDKGEPFTANKSHRLPLCDPDRNKVIMTVGEYLSLPDEEKANLRLYGGKVDIFYRLPEHQWYYSYGIGQLIGNCNSNHLQYMIKNSCADVHYNFGSLNKLYSQPETLSSLWYTLSIPEELKYAGRDNRRDLIAGIVDQCGEVSGNTYIIRTRFKNLAEDLIFVCRSIGLKTWVEETKEDAPFKSYKNYIVHIEGACWLIPSRDSNKRIKYSNDWMSAYTYPFEVEYLGEDQYYGFTVSGNQSYLTSNFIAQMNSGKSILFGMVAKEVKARTLVIAHREELLQQAEKKIHLVYPKADIGILQASERKGLDSEICVASIQTAVRHIPELQARGFKLAICDEAHHIVAKTYKTLFESLGFLDDSPDKLLLGVTATAFRADKEQLGDVFQEVVFERSITTMIRSGYLCDVKGLAVETSVDLSDVKTRTGDFAVDELAVAVDTPARNALVADAYMQYGENRHGIVFAVKVDHALHLADEFKSRGISCEAVYGAMPYDQRRDILKRYAKGEIQIVTNVAVLTEGWDAPSTDIILLARPTQSQGLAIQMIGRGLRTAPNKKDCLIIDFVDTTKKHNLCGISVLHNDEEEKEARQGSLFDNDREGTREPEAVDDSPAVITGVQAIDIFDRSQFTWQSLGSNYRIWLADGSSVCCYTEDNESFLPVLVLSNGKCQNLADEPLPLGYALGTCEDYVRQLNNKYARVSQKDAEWRFLPATEKQIAALRNMSIPFEEEGLTRGGASALLESKLNIPPTARQLWFIQQHKLHDIPQLLTKAEASRIIEKAKAEGADKPKKKKRL